MRFLYYKRMRRVLKALLQKNPEKSEKTA